MPSSALKASSATRIAERAAQLLCNEHGKDIKLARQQAMHDLGLSKHDPQPSDSEIELAVTDYRRLFNPEYDDELLKLRQKALALLNFFQAFQPYLVGSVLKGSACKHSDINLLVYSDDPKSIEIFLLNQQIDYDCRERKTQYRQTDAPNIAFWFDQSQVNLQVLPSSARHQHSKKTDRANLAQLTQLLANDSVGSLAATLD